jgi:two-component system cell cycle sensor histidine kinase/response regulator CckA
LILKKAGYSVVDASCADQAQVAWGQVAFDILVTDYDMPGRNGVELAELLRSQKPDLNVVLISGLSLEGVMLPCGVRFLQKPFTTADFLKTLSATPLSDGKSVTAN